MAKGSTNKWARLDQITGLMEGGDETTQQERAAISYACHFAWTNFEQFVARYGATAGVALLSLRDRRSL